jgi:hypothetical protein
MARNKNMPAIAFIDMHGEVDLHALPVGTLIVTVGTTENVTHEDRQYMKFGARGSAPTGGQWDDPSLAEDLNEQTRAGRRAIARYVPTY